MKRITALVAIASLLCLGGAAMAEIGAVDNVPAATLLLPRFEVKLGVGPGGGTTTLFSINNASDETILTHVTVWSELWVPVLDFDVYLTGYDVQTINLYDIIVNGDLPNTGPNDTLSPTGEFSGGHTNFGGTCGTSLGTTPNYANIQGLFLTLIQQSLSGQPLSTTGKCASANKNTTVARGYITVDTVSECGTDFPNDEEYFQDGGNGVATNQNVIWGDYFIIDPANNFAQGWTLVHIEADGFQLLGESGSCNDESSPYFPRTFYCTTAVNGGDTPGEDNREALPSVYASRYAIGGGFDGGTQITAWRDPNATTFAPVTCGGQASMTQQQLVVFDEEENPITQGQGPSGFEPPSDVPFPLCTNKANVGTDISIESNFGWIYMNLNIPVSTAFPGLIHQAYVTTTMSALGRFSVGYDAIALNNLNRFEVQSWPRFQIDPFLGSSDPDVDGPTLWTLQN